jgi:hypothetical protein
VNRIQSKYAVGTDGAASESAVGPMRGFVNVLREAGRPTGRNSTPSNEYSAVSCEPSEIRRT